jgi:hypothetical protein
VEGRRKRKGEVKQTTAFGDESVAKASLSVFVGDLNVVPVGYDASTASK